MAKHGLFRSSCSLRRFSATHQYTPTFLSVCFRNGSPQGISADSAHLFRNFSGSAFFNKPNPSPRRHQTMKHLQAGQKIHPHFQLHQRRTFLSGVVSQLVDRYSVGAQQRRIILAERYFNAAKRRATDQLWHTHGRVSTAFRPRHSLLALHVWLLHRRLLLQAEGTTTGDDDANNTLNPTTDSTGTAAPLSKSSTLLVQEELFEILWHDTKARIRAAGIQELMVEKNLKDVQNLTFQLCLALDHAVSPLDSPSNNSSTSDIKDGETLNNSEAAVMVTNPYRTSSHAEQRKKRDNVGLVLWTHIYLSGETVPDSVVDALAEYVLHQFDNVCHDLPERYWMEGRVGWVPIPDFGSAAGPDEGEESDEGPVAPPLEEPLPKGWFRALTDSGDTYYWNEETMRSSWESPLASGTSQEATSG